MIKRKTKKRRLNLDLFVLTVVLIIVLTSVAGADDPTLIGWWKLDEGSGDTANDSSGSGNHGTIHNTMSGLGEGGSVWVNNSERGTILSFNGDESSGAYVSAGTIPAMSLTNDFTWAFWAKQDDSGTGSNDVILGNREGGTQEPLQFIKFTPTRFEYYCGDHDGTINYGEITDGVWIHHVVVKDGATLTYYRNGEVAGTNTTSSSIDENPFYIGGDIRERWRGWISDVRIYNRALTQVEIMSIMGGGGFDLRSVSVGTDVGSVNSHGIEICGTVPSADLVEQIVVKNPDGNVVEMSEFIWSDDGRFSAWSGALSSSILFPGIYKIKVQYTDASNELRRIDIPAHLFASAVPTGFGIIDWWLPEGGQIPQPTFAWDPFQSPEFDPVNEHLSYMIEVSDFWVAGGLEDIQVDYNFDGSAAPGYETLPLGNYVAFLFAYEKQYDSSYSLDVGDEYRTCRTALTKLRFFIAEPTPQVHFEDPALKAAVEEALGVTDPTEADMLNLEELGASGLGIADLTGLEYAENLTRLDLRENEIIDISPLSETNLQWLHAGTNQISDLNPLSSLSNLTELRLDWNRISDLAPISGLTNLERLDAENNEISNLVPISGLTNLWRLELGHNERISDITPISGLTKLRVLWLHNNLISNIATLSGLTELTELWLYNNEISDIAALSGLMNLDNLELQNNPLNCEAYLTFIPLIEENNPQANIQYDEMPPECLNTPPGQDVEVSDPETGTTMLFDNVGSGGETTVTITQHGPPPPTGLKLVPLGTYYEIDTTAEFTGMVHIAIEYDDTGLTTGQERALKLRCYEEAKDEWVNITTDLDMVNNIIYGETNHLSFFAITRGILVEIDIKPGSYPNAINLGSQGIIPVAILSSSDFDATTVNPDTIELAGAGVAVRGKGDKYLANEEDIDGDGLLDLVCKVETENLDPNAFQYGFADLTGETYDGVSIKGEDEIIIVPPE